MENQTNFNNPSGNIENKPKKRRVAWIIIILVVILAALFLILGGYNNIKMTVKGLWAVNQFNKGVELYEKTMTEDIYGGKTPEETLAMFIEALEKGDIELASRYFVLDDNLSQEKWKEGLRVAQQENRISNIIEIAKKAQKSTNQSGLNTEFEFMILGQDDLAEYTIFMELNEYSGIWKIKSM